MYLERFLPSIRVRLHDVTRVMDSADLPLKSKGKDRESVRENSQLIGTRVAAPTAQDHGLQRLAGENPKVEEVNPPH